VTSPSRDDDDDDDGAARHVTTMTVLPRAIGSKTEDFCAFIAYHNRFMYNIILSRRSAACARAPRHDTESERDGDGANRWRTRRARAGQTETVREKLERARAVAGERAFRRRTRF